MGVHSTVLSNFFVDFFFQNSLETVFDWTSILYRNVEVRVQR